MALLKAKKKVPATVLSQAQKAVERALKPSPPAPPPKRATLARAKVVAALKKLHPMD